MPIIAFEHIKINACHKLAIDEPVAALSLLAYVVCNGLHPLPVLTVLEIPEQPLSKSHALLLFIL